MTGGDFNAEAYEQLRAAYADQQTAQVDQELAGKEIMGQKMSLETLPVDSPWMDKISNWEYPDGKSAYLDEKQSPEEILEIMRESAQARVDQSKEIDEKLDAMSDEEFDTYVDDILAKTEGEEEEDGDEEGLSDEDLDKIVADLLSDDPEESDETEENEEEEEDEDPVLEPEVEVEVQAELQTEDEVEEEVLADPSDLADQIAELKAEISHFQFVNEDQANDESNIDTSGRTGD